MVTDNPENNKEEQPSGSQTPTYEDMIQEEPERMVKVEDYKPDTRTVTEEEEEGESQSDIKYIMKSLTPVFKNKKLNEYVRSAMVSRIPPDNITDKLFLITASLIEAQSFDDDFDPVAIITQAQDALFIGFEGRGIADRLEIAGVVKEADLEKLSKELGMAS